jgi:hypothetical protein
MRTRSIVRLAPSAAAGALAAALAACGGGASPGPGANPANTGGASAAFPAPRQLGLFVEGAAWTYEVSTTSTSTHDDGSPAKATRTASVRCQVEAVRQLPDAVVSTVTCDGTMAVGTDEPVAGTWVATDAGVWRVAGPDVDPAALAADDALLAARPEAGRVSTTIDEELGHLRVRAVSNTGADACLAADDDAAWRSACVDPAAATWCAGELFAAGDESWQTVCVDAGGVAGGSGGWAGGMVEEYRFTRTGG